MGRARQHTEPVPLLAAPALPLGQATARAPCAPHGPAWQLSRARISRAEALEAAPALSRRDTQLLGRSRSRGRIQLGRPSCHPRLLTAGIRAHVFSWHLPSPRPLPGAQLPGTDALRGRPEQGWECCSCSLPAPPLHGKDRNISHLMMTAVLSQPHLKDEGRRENAPLTNSTGKLKELKSRFLQIWVGRSGEQLLRSKGASPRVSIYH